MYDVMCINISAGPLGATRLRRMIDVLQDLLRYDNILFLILLLIVLCWLVYNTAKKRQIHLPLWSLPGSLDPSKTMLPPGRECHPAHSGVPGPLRDPGQALGISKGLQHDVQGHHQQPPIFTRCIYVYIYMYICIYIYREREREIKR